MPELPEVETVRSQLAPVVTGREIETVEITDPRWCSPLDPELFCLQLEGRRIQQLSRRGKYLIAELSDQLFLIMHLRMTGIFLINSQDQRHLRGRIGLNGGDHIDFVDPRRFGTAELIEGKELLNKYFERRLGPEPFEDRFDANFMFKLTRGRKTPIKALLLNQRAVAGIGNIYADEALFRARVDPRTEAGSLTRKSCALLADAVVVALQAGIDAKGATIDDFRHADGAYGSFQNSFLVHRREGLACPQCETPIQKLRVAGRGTYICSSCQKS